MTTIATPDADSAARQDLLERYARLAIRVGINLEPGREVAIRAMIEHAPLVRALVRAGYEAGARRVEVAQRIEAARALGDLSENGDYHAAKDDQGKMEARIRHIKAMLKNQAPKTARPIPCLGPAWLSSSSPSNSYPSGRKTKEVL